MHDVGEFWVALGVRPIPEPGPGSPPSEHTRRWWVRVADTYDPQALRPLWSFTADQIKAATRAGPVGAPLRAVLQSSSIAIAVAHRLEGVEPTSDLTSIAYAFNRLRDIPVCWKTMQDSVEALALRWEAMDC